MGVGLTLHRMEGGGEGDVDSGEFSFSTRTELRIDPTCHAPARASMKILAWTFGRSWTLVFTVSILYLYLQYLPVFDHIRASLCLLFRIKGFNDHFSALRAFEVVSHALTHERKKKS